LTSAPSIYDSQEGAYSDSLLGDRVNQVSYSQAFEPVTHYITKSHYYYIALK